jgi:hypothetical protein
MRKTYFFELLESMKPKPYIQKNEFHGADLKYYQRILLINGKFLIGNHDEIDSHIKQEDPPLNGNNDHVHYQYTIYRLY